VSSLSERHNPAGLDTEELDYDLLDLEHLYPVQFDACLVYEPGSPALFGALAKSHA